MLDAWLNNGMAVPYIMASTTWMNTSGCAYPDVRIAGTSHAYYSSLQTAYDEAGNDTIQSHDAVFGGDLYIDDEKTIIFEGGYNCDYSSNTGGTTSVNGDMIVSNGTITIFSGTLEII